MGEDELEDIRLGHSIMTERIRSEKLQKIYGGKNNMEKNAERSYSAGIELIEKHFERKLEYNADEFVERMSKFKKCTQEYQLTVAFVNRINEISMTPINADMIFNSAWYGEQANEERERLLQENTENEERIYKDKQKCILEYDLCETYEQRVACLEKWEIL